MKRGWAEASRGSPVASKLAVGTLSVSDLSHDAAVRGSHETVLHSPLMLTIPPTTLFGPLDRLLGTARVVKFALRVVGGQAGE